MSVIRVDTTETVIKKPVDAASGTAARRPHLQFLVVVFHLQWENLFRAGEESRVKL